MSIETRARPIIYLVVFIVVGLPLVYPLGLPNGASEYSLNYYREIQSLPEGSIVIMNYDIEATGWDELKSQVIATVKHLMARPVKILFVSDHVLGAAFVEKSLDLVQSHIDANGKEYGIDYVILGYLPGEAAVAAMATDFHQLITVDYYGNSVAGTFLDDIVDGSDIQLVVSIDSFSGIGPYINHFYLKYGTTLLEGCLGGMIPGAINTYQVGQIQGLLGGIPGGAEYEYLTGYPGEGIKSTDAVSLIHLMGIGMIVLGNVVYFRKKSGGN